MKINLFQAKHFILHLLSAKRKGHGVHSPFVYKLCEEVFYNKDTFYDLEVLRLLRKGLLRNNEILQIDDLGAGSKYFETALREVGQLVKHGTSSARQSEILYKLINFLNCQECIELGTSIGLTTLYLAKAMPNGMVHTIEGSSSLYDFASGLALTNEQQNIKFYHGNFDSIFPKVLSKLNKLDLLFVDGNHTMEATVKYFDLALQKRSGSTVIIFDDIYWSAGMKEAWDHICNHNEVTISIDCFYFGLVFFRPEPKEKIHLKLKI